MIQLSRREALLGLASLSSATLLAGCAMNPVTGKRQLMLLSEAQERAMGEQAHQDILTSYGIYDDNDIQDCFDQMGKNIAQISHRNQLQYTFTLLDSPVVNAFAVPGGYIYLTRGILGYFNNEAQFASVLGHEIGHVAARHTAVNYSKAMLANITLELAKFYSEDFRKFSQFVSFGVSLLFLKYSREDEHQSDRLGVDYATAVGYDAAQMGVFFHTLERLQPEGGALPGWLSTHPDPGDRIEATLDLTRIMQQSRPPQTYLVKRNEYLDMVDGIVFGTDPNQGYVQDSVFYHPALRFQFPFPSGWDVANGTTEVRIAPGDQNAVMIFTFAQGSGPRLAARNFATNYNIDVTDVQTTTINDMPGFRTLGSLTAESGKLAILSYFIEKDDVIYVFHGLSSPGDMNSYYGKFENAALGFDALTDPKFLDVSPKKIHIRPAQQQKSLRQAFNDFGVPENELEKLAVLNGMELSEEISSGTRIKIVA